MKEEPLPPTEIIDTSTSITTTQKMSTNPNSSITTTEKLTSNNSSFISDINSTKLIQEYNNNNNLNPNQNLNNNTINNNNDVQQQVIPPALQNIPSIQVPQVQPQAPFIDDSNDLNLPDLKMFKLLLRKFRLKKKPK